MTAALHIAERTDRMRPAFADRAEAGRRLAAYVAPVPDPRALVLALPRGGVPVAAPLADALGCELRPVMVRKLPVPAMPEAGFGAVTLDGTVTLNRGTISAFGIDEPTVARTVAEVRRELARRARAYSGGERLPSLAGRHVFLVDDGLASGYTMIAAADMVRRQRPRLLTVTVPAAPADTVRRVAGHCDELYCLIELRAASFAVASFYTAFPDLTDEEVRAVLER